VSDGIIERFERKYLVIRETFSNSGKSLSYDAASPSIRLWTGGVACRS
jgi:hypothetical protein